MTRKFTQEDFVSLSESAHNVKHDYTRAAYKGTTSMVEITCILHAATFVQRAGLHMSGSTACPQCLRDKKMSSRLTKRAASVPNGCKLCKTCGSIKTFENFVPNSDGASGYYSVCRDCCAKRAACSRSNPEYRAAMKKRNQEYTRNNKDKANAKSAKRRARRIQATPRWAESEFEQFVIKEAYNLSIIRSKVTGFNWQVDHLVPLNSDLCCGLHCAANLAVIPESENKRKRNIYWPDMWQ